MSLIEHNKATFEREMDRLVIIAQKLRVPLWLSDYVKKSGFFQEVGS